MRRCEVRDCGRIGYRRSVRAAARARRAAQAGRDSRSTAVRRASSCHHSRTQRAHGKPAGDPKTCLARPASSFYETDRGGDVTYHGPGQIVGYPIFDLREWKRDVVAYVRALEQSIIDALAEFGIEGGREPGATGVWTREGKICAIGVHISRWVTSHGFALNVHYRSELFSIHRPVRTHQTGDVHAGSRP